MGGNAGASLFSGLGETAAGTGSALGFLGTVASAAGPIGQIVSSAISIFQAFNIGGGCGNNCIDAAKLQETIECALDDIGNVVIAQYLDGSDGAAMMAGILQAGLDQLANLANQGDSNAQAAITLLNGQAPAHIQKIQGYGGPTELAPTGAQQQIIDKTGHYQPSKYIAPIVVMQSVFLSPTRPGWYPSSIVAGNEIATQTLESFLNGMTAQQSSASASPILSQILSSLSANLNQARATAGEKLGSILGGLSALTGALSSSSGSVGDQVLGSILGTVGVSAGTSSEIANAVGGALGDVTTGVNFINKDIVGKVLQPLLAGMSANQDLITKLTAELSGGLTGLLAIPKTLSDALTSQTAATLAGVKLTNEARQNVASTITVPGIGGAISDALKASNESFAQIFAQKKEPLSPFTEIAPGAIDLTTAVDNLNATARKYLALVAPEMDIFGGALLKLVNFLLEASGTLNVLVKLQEIQTQANFTVLPLGAGEAVRAAIRGAMTQADAEAEAKYSGMSQARFEIATELQQQLIPIRDAILASARGIITDVEAAAEAGRGAWTPQRIGIVRELMTVIQQPGILFDWYVRGGLTQEAFTAALKAQMWSDADIELAQVYLKRVPPLGLLAGIHGRQSAAAKGFLAGSYTQQAPMDIDQLNTQNVMTPENANMMWLDHWKSLDTFTWLNAYFRNIINKDFFAEAMESDNYPPEVTDTIIEANRPLINFFYVPEMMAAGVFGEQEARDYLAKYGFDQAAIDATIKFGAFKALGKTTLATAGFAQLSLANLKTLYANGTITQEQYVTSLVSHGYSTSNAELLAELETTALQIKARTAEVTTLEDQVKTGAITEQAALDKLGGGGYTQEEIAKFQVSVRTAVAAQNKLPTEAQLKTMLKDGIISEAVWSDTMGQLGYSIAWRERLIQLI